MLRGIVENHNLFSNHYLENILPTLPEWSRDDHTGVLDIFRQRYEAPKFEVSDQVLFHGSPAPVALEFEETQGRTAVDVVMEFLGYDLRSHNGDERYTEVKGFESSGAIELTLSEWGIADRLGQDYWIHVVEDALGEGALSLIRDPLSRCAHALSRIEDVRYQNEDWKPQAQAAE